MIRKLARAMAIGASALTLLSCGGNSAGSFIESDSGSANRPNALVAYFSKSGENYGVGTVEKGNTAIMAENIHSFVGGTLFEIEPVSKYPDDYEEATEIAQKEKNSNARPTIKNAVGDFGSFDAIFLGYPIWYGDWPMIINTFLESYDFTGKTVIPFNTHEGSGDAGTFARMKDKLPSSAVLDGLSIRGATARQNESRKTIESWLARIGFGSNSNT